MGSNDPPERRLRIAILGGGIAGATAAIALSQLPHVHVDVFDQASALREIGASIALQPCALRCLEKLGLGEEVEKLAWRYGEHPLVHRHWKTAKVIPTPLPDPLPEFRHQLARFYRVHLHQLLLSRIPASSIHLGKRVADVQVLETDEVRVVFEDGSDWAGNAVVGADGIRSRTRQVFYPDYQLGLGGLVTLRQVYETKLLRGIEGIPSESCHWIGPDRQLFTSPLKGDLFSLVAFLPTNVLAPSDQATSTSRSWGTTTSVSNLANYYADWHPTIAAITRSAPSINLYPDYHGPPLASLSVGEDHVVLIGDAGHPHGGAFAAGGSLAIEDAYTLYLCLKDGRSVQDAWSLFDQVRKEHVHRLLRMAEKLRKQRKDDEGKYLNDDEIRQRVEGRGDVTWLAENDVEQVVEKAKEARHEAREKNSA
ncbi:hypothetical protein BCR39DRAFT_547657 [Naematelia encephala]|uniref:FAD-binding domain-containing protein n=1 Tax=Naematelia encephala TaxID=71784 RepID=A0A1Y2ANI2_9TREE|nr:hypothetical protein BCR39DRAFT_547657 [Naematelia encephala]